MGNRSLSRVTVGKDLRTEITVNQRLLEGVGVYEGDSVLLLDGMVLQEGGWDVFRLAILGRGHFQPSQYMASCGLQLD